MADSNTPNILLLLPDLNDTFNFSLHVEANFTTIDSLMGAVQCNSTTRPTNTYAGQIVYETDSLRYAQNTGTKSSAAWTYMSHQALSTSSSSRPTSGLTAGELIYETDTTVVRPRGSGVWLPNIASCTSGARPANPVTGDLVVETNTSRMIQWNGSSWLETAFSNWVTTSSAHPGAPFTGLEIYETNTGLSGIYNGSAYMYSVGQLAATQILGTTTASVTFSGIPAVTRVLVLSRHRNSAAAVGDVLMQLDGNTGNNYLWTKVETNGTSVAGTHAGTATSSAKVAVCSGDTANYFGNMALWIDGWSNSTGFATWSGTHANYDTQSNDWAGSVGGLFGAVGPHTSIKLFLSANSFAAGCQFSIYAVE